VAAISKKFDNFAINVSYNNSANIEDSQTMETLQAIASKNNPYSNYYNPGWKNHPNFNWNNSQQQWGNNQSNPNGNWNNQVH
ncbi:hypothetical protein, partial [Enterobacter sp. HPCN14]|uniref:hypothetical protein n=1 Tax=Enterobacter sp. HPCN14 TaxID=2202832 RepID=UPI0015E875C7